MNRIFGIALILIFGIIGWAVFYLIPMEASMGITQKIMYIHVPSIWMAFLAILIAFIASLLYLWKRTERIDIVAHSSVELGVVFCGLALVTGSIWARPTWNTYWSWDARLTTTLILFLIFVGYLLLRKFTDYGERQARICAVVAIIGFLDVPLIHMSVVWWRTLHQPSTMFSPKQNVIDKPLLVMLWVCVLAFTLLFLYLLSNRIKLEKSTRQYQQEAAKLNRF